MTVSRAKKDERLRILVAHVRAERVRTGRRAFEQALARRGPRAWLHDLINDRGHAERVTRRAAERVPSELRRHEALGSTATWRVIGPRADGSVYCESVDVPGLPAGTPMWLSEDAVERMERVES